MLNSNIYDIFSEVYPLKCEIKLQQTVHKHLPNIYR